MANKSDVFHKLFLNIRNFVQLSALLPIIFLAGISNSYGEGVENMFAPMYYQEGIRKLDSGETEQAIEQFNRALNYDQEYIPAYLQRAAIYEQLGKYRKAITDLDRVLKLDKFNAKAFVLEKNKFKELI